MSNFKKIDLRDHFGDVYVCGDIHGCFSRLEAELASIGFDFDNDLLYCVGDLVDRGPESHRALEFLDKPWFHSLAGNHEHMTIDAGGTSWHTSNGGQWFKKLKYKIGQPKQAEFVQRFKKLPIIIELQLKDKRIGLVHADYPDLDWNNAERVAQHLVEPCLWSRSKITAVGQGIELLDIQNIDHVYYGHTPVKEPLTIGNQSWIDTGAVFGNSLTIIKVS